MALFHCGYWPTDQAADALLEPADVRPVAETSKLAHRYAGTAVDWSQMFGAARSLAGAGKVVIVHAHPQNVPCPGHAHRLFAPA